jgi:hypothetical protein
MAGQLAPVLDLPPAEDLAHQQPRAHGAYATQVHQATHLVDLVRLIVAEIAAQAILEVVELSVHESPALELTQDARPKFRGHGPAVPLAQ